MCVPAQAGTLMTDSECDSKSKRAGLGRVDVYKDMCVNKDLYIFFLSHLKY